MFSLGLPSLLSFLSLKWSFLSDEQANQQAAGSHCQLGSKLVCGQAGTARLQAGNLSQTHEGREASGGLSLAVVQSLDLKSCCFTSARSPQLGVDSPNCPELLYLMLLGDGLCRVTLVPNSNFYLQRLEDESAEQQFRHIAMAVALMAMWENISRVSNLSTTSSTWTPSWGFWEPPRSSAPRSWQLSRGPKKMLVLQQPLIVEEQMHGQDTPFWMASGRVHSAWSGNGHNLAPVAHLWAQPELRRLLTLTAIGAVVLPKAPEKGQSPAQAEVCCVQGVPYLC